MNSAPNAQEGVAMAQNKPRPSVVTNPTGRAAKKFRKQVRNSAALVWTDEMAKALKRLRGQYNAWRVSAIISFVLVLSLGIMRIAGL